MRYLLFVATILAFNTSYSQTKWLIWSHHDLDTEEINGISFGVGSFIPKGSKVNGVKLDFPGLGLFLPSGIGDDPFNPSYLKNDSLTLQFFLNKKKSIEEDKLITTNGIFLSLTGDVESIVNGFSLNPIGGITEVSNGLNVNGFMGFVTINNGLCTSLLYLSTGTSNGVSISLLYNSTIELNGIQIGLFNTSFKTRGVQFGLWNKNEKRSLPFINWN